MENLSPRHPWGFKWLIKVIPLEKSYQTIFFKLPLNVCNLRLLEAIVCKVHVTIEKSLRGRKSQAFRKKWILHTRNLWKNHSKCSSSHSFMVMICILE